MPTNEEIAEEVVEDLRDAIDDLDLEDAIEVASIVELDARSVLAGLQDDKRRQEAREAP